MAELKYSKAAYIEHDVGQYRIDYPDETKPFKDKALFDLVMQTEDDMEPDAWRAYFTSFHPGSAPPVSSQPVPDDVSPESTHLTLTAQRGHVQALAFARKGGAALSALLGAIATRKEQERMGPCEMALFLETHYTDDEVCMIPVVGSKKEDTGNKPYDKYTTPVQTKDGKKMVPGSWFTDAIRATAEYTAIVERKAWCDGDNVDTMPADIAAMGTGERAMEKERLNQRVKDMRTALTRGAMLFHHVAEIAALNPARIKVKMPYRTRKNPDGTEYTEVYGNTVRLQDPANELEDKIFSVSQFNALRPAKLPTVADKADPSKLDKTGWDIVALEKTGDRPPKTKGGKGKQQTIATPTTVEALLNLFNIAGTAIDVETEQGSKLNTMLLSACATAGEKGDDVVETVGDFALSIDAIWTLIDKRYNGIKARKAASLNQREPAKVPASN